MPPRVLRNIVQEVHVDGSYRWPVVATYAEQERHDRCRDHHTLRRAAIPISSQMRLTASPIGTRKYGPKIVWLPLT